MRDVILEDKRMTIDDFQIIRTQEKEVWNKSREKEFNLRYDKRKVQWIPEGIDTLPWGYLLYPKNTIKNKFVF